jgi:predicted RNA-binding Zn-ribbon protein involved in translation (DUF1610 family)
MKITRNGVDFELTREEMKEAHDAYALLCETECVKKHIPKSDIFNALPENIQNAFCAEVAMEARCFLERYGCSWHAAVDNVYIFHKDYLPKEYVKAMLSEREPFKSIPAEEVDDVYEEIADFMEGLMIREGKAVSDALKEASEIWAEDYDAEIHSHNEEKCSHCGATVDLDDCESDKYWTNNGDRIVYHVCPMCGDSVERISFD